ncbi:MAG: DUF4364 family protein, partial [Oscillibacter sp.]|nr:DUF4364 family protein [Oscillibacter sp.]
ELEQKILILYILSRLAEPVPFDMLLDMSLCDDGIHYFDFTERLSELVDTGHVACPEEKLYRITDKGRRTAGICETELPYTVRMRCNRNADKCNRVLRRQEQVRTSAEARLNGTFTARMILDDDIGNLMDLQVMAPDKAFADKLIRHFQGNPERLYHRLMNLLLAEEPEPGQVAEKAETVASPEKPENVTAPKKPETVTAPASPNAIHFSQNPPKSPLSGGTSGT